MKIELVVALIGGGSALLGALVAFTGAGFLQWQRGRQEDRAAETRAISELLAAAVMLTLAVQTFRTAWIGAWRVPSPKRIARDLDTTLGPKLDRLVRALSDITQRRERRSRPLVAAAKRLTDAAGGLVEAAGAQESAYRQRRAAFEAALGDFRKAVDERAV